MEEGIKGRGLITKSTDMVYIPGQMGENMKEIIKTTKNMGQALTLGQTGESMSGNGKMTKGTGEVNIL